VIRKVALGALCASLCACGPRAAWHFDESDRIDEVMACPPWRPGAPEAPGIALAGAPPLAEPWLDGEGYQLRRTPPKSGRKKRLGKVQRTPPRHQAGPTGASR
jgi:hypothetical protein